MKMKSKLLIVALIGLLLAGGMVLASCGRTGCPGSGTCESKNRRGSRCSNISYNSNTKKYSGCAVYKGVSGNDDGKCDC